MGHKIAAPADEVDVSDDTLGIDEMLASIELQMSDESVGGNDDDDAPDSVGGTMTMTMTMTPLVAPAMATPSPSGATTRTTTRPTVRIKSDGTP